MDWEEASVGEGKASQPEAAPKEFEMSIDDLVFMIGQGTVKEWHANKIITSLQRQIATLQGTLASEKSKQASLQEKIATLEEEVISRNKQQLIQAMEEKEAISNENALLKERFVVETNKIAENQAEMDKVRESYHSRIVQLENQLHEVAIERNSAREETRSALDELRALKAAKEKKKRI